MIIDLLVSAVLGAFTAVLGLVPEWTPPWTSVIVWGTLGSALATIDRFFPLATVVEVGAIAIAFRVIVSVYHLGVWAYEHFPFKAT